MLPLILCVRLMFQFAKAGFHYVVLVLGIVSFSLGLPSQVRGKFDSYY